MQIERVALWLWVVVLGTAFGAGIYEHRIVTPDWLAETSSGSLEWRAEAARRDDTGPRFWAFVSTGPLTLLTLANLGLAWRSRLATRRMWLAAGVLGLTERILTFTYFIPTMVRLMAAPPSADAVADASLWLAMNHVRHALTLATWIPALRTLVNYEAKRAS
jgi:hypothetical protein